MVELNTREHQPQRRGQAMTEYALILALLAISFGVALAATGPQIGNVFCNVVHNIGGSSASPQGGTCGSAAPDLSAGDTANFWQTVTWVAENPQGETPFPTPIRRAPTSVSGGLLPTATKTYTPTKTPTYTPTFTFTPSYTPSPGPSPTSSDFVFQVPYVDQISKPEWWRLDTGDFMGYTPWRVDWYDDFPNVTCTAGICTIFLANKVGNNPALTYNINGINFDWGSGFPAGSGITNGDNWGAIFDRDIVVADDGIYEFTMGANNYGTLYLDGTAVFTQQAMDTSTTTKTVPIMKGNHTLSLVYGEATVNASVSLTVERLTVNPADVTTGSNSCTWGQSSGNTIPVSVSFMFEDNPGQTTWPAGQTCNLELRGYVDLTGHSNPTLSFWDIWDFTGAADVNAVLQVSPYVDLDPLPNEARLDRTALVWQTIATHAAGTSNYAWTRRQVDLSSLGLSGKVTFRFVIGSAAGGNPFRWYIDDIQVVDAPAHPAFILGQTWDLDNRDQMRDFIFDGDSNKTIEDNLSTHVPNTRETYRWDLTSNNAHAGSGWDDSPGVSYQNIPGLTPHTPPTTPRIHPLELRYPVDLSGTNPTTDVPLLSFWQAYDIRLNSSIRVEYTRDANDMVPDNWTPIPNQGILIDYSLPALVGRTKLAMQPIDIDLTNVPNWNTQPFRLRFALYVGESATDFGDGWYIDDIKIALQDPSPYFAFPFIDDAEYIDPNDSPWDVIGGRWGQTVEKAGAEGTGTAYSDSPLGQYDPLDVQMMQLHYAIDLLEDSPNNGLSYTPALDPTLTFWHQRNVNAGTFSVEMWTADTNTWTSIWEYDAASDTSFKTQLAWEPVEIDLKSALQTISGLDWTAIGSNATNDDDDIKIRFNFSTPAGPASDGVYVDQIRIDNASAVVHHLWPTGNGVYKDSIETGVNLPAGAWQTRWLRGGEWGTTGVTKHSGSLALTDSLPGSYLDNTFSVMEMIPKMDLTSTVAADRPTMYFWTQYMVGSDDTLRVEISYKDSADLSQNYDKIGGWSAWAAQPIMVGSSVTDSGADTLNNTGVITWERAQVNLASFIGKQIRIRFVMRVPNAANQADGIYIDDVQFDFGPPQLTLTFTDNAQTTTNWITEGTWGLAQNYFIGRGTSALDFGSSSWVGNYFDCEPLKVAGETCTQTTTSPPSITTNDANTYAHILSYNLDYPAGHTPQGDLSNPAVIGPELLSEVNFNWGSTHRPLSDTSPDINPDGSGYRDTFAARWTRAVTLSPGTYSFSIVSKDSVRLIISDRTGTTGTAPVNPGDPTDKRGYIVNDWGDHVPRLDYTTLTVTANISPTLTLEYYHNQGDALIILNATKSSFSFTDSPNPPDSTSPSGFTLTNSVYPGNSSLMINGFFNLLPTSSHVSPSLQYQRLYDLKVNTKFYVEVSTDGGFTWLTVGSETLTGPISNLPPGGYWQPQTVPLASPVDYRSANTMIRFRLDTRSATAASGGTGDGVYIAEIRVTP